jgi:hypothetical protein
MVCSILISLRGAANRIISTSACPDTSKASRPDSCEDSSLVQNSNHAYLLDRIGFCIFKIESLNSVQTLYKIMFVIQMLDRFT